MINIQTIIIFYLVSFDVFLDLKKHILYSSIRKPNSLNSIPYTSCQSANLILYVVGETVLFEEIQSMLLVAQTLISHFTS